jgi:ABC-type branched-subunit amino acid transport system substrate-binding protein
MAALLKPRRRWVAALTAAVCALASATALTVGAGAQGNAPFKIMVITGINTIANNAPEMPKTAQAAADQINKQGGLGGRQIQILSCNDGSDATQTAACGRQAVDANVDDIIQYDGFTVNSLPITNAAGIPHIASFPFSPNDYFDKLTFPLTVGVAGAYEGGAAVLALDKSNKRWAGLGTQGSLASNQTLAVPQTLIRQKGRTWVGTTLVPRANVDFGPVIQKLRGQNPDVVISSMPPANTFAFMAQIAQFNLPWKVLVITNINEFDAPNLAGKEDQVTVGTYLPPYSATSIPGVAKFNADLKAAGLADDPHNLTPNGMYAWMAVNALKQLSLRVKGPVTKESMIAAARAVKAKNPINVFGLVKWAPGEKGPAVFPNLYAAYGYGEKFVNGKLQLINKTPIDLWGALGIKPK